MVNDSYNKCHVLEIYNRQIQSRYAIIHHREPASNNLNVYAEDKAPMETDLSAAVPSDARAEAFLEDSTRGTPDAVGDDAAEMVCEAQPTSDAS